MENGQLKAVYDPRILSNEHAMQVIRQSGEAAALVVAQCAAKREFGAPACANCAGAMGKVLMAQYQAAAKLPSASFHNGVIAAKAGVDEYHAGLLPQDKVTVLKALQNKYSPVAMVGDGVNDAPSLATADIGIAMGGAGTDVAIETADVVLMSDDLHKIPFAIGLACRAEKVIWQNLIFAMAVIVILVASAFGVRLPLPLGVLGHEGSTVLVVSNGLRLLEHKGV